jgi:lipopolysaccharide transport system permease protein
MDSMASKISDSVAYLRRVHQLRYFWWALVTNDIKNRYRNSFLGTAWSLARPIGMTVVLTVVFSTAFNMSIKEYAPFLFLSIALWQFLTESMSTGCMAFREASAHIRQQPLPLAIFPLRTVLRTSIHAGLALLVALVVSMFFNGASSVLVAFSALPGLMILFLVGLALATLLGILHTHFPDTQHLVEIVLQALFYLTPVMYKANAFANRGRLTYLINCNPFTSLLELVRQPLLDGLYPDPVHLLQATAFLLVVGTLAWLCLWRFERTLVYWI